MKQQRRSKQSGGFTLLELLVVIIIVGVLMAIAAPGWFTFLNRQRISAAREQVTQTIRTAQSEARRTRAPRMVVFDANSGKPRVATVPYVSTTTLPVTASTITNWELLGNGNLSSGTIQIATNQGLTRPTSTNRALVFDGNGAVATLPGLTQALPFVVTVSSANIAGRANDRCVVVDTLLGAIRTEEGAFNGTKGCLP